MSERSTRAAVVENLLGEEVDNDLAQTCQCKTSQRVNEKGAESNAHE